VVRFILEVKIFLGDLEVLDVPLQHLPVNEPKYDLLVLPALVHHGPFSSGPFQGESLKLPTDSCTELRSSGKIVYPDRSLIPQQATGNALAPGFKLPTDNCTELRSSGKIVYPDRSLIPQQATGNALAPGFTD
jgi:hypothetical protein